MTWVPLVRGELPRTKAQLELALRHAPDAVALTWVKYYAEEPEHPGLEVPGDVVRIGIAECTMLRQLYERTNRPVWAYLMGRDHLVFWAGRADTKPPDVHPNHKDAGLLGRVDLGKGCVIMRPTSTSQAAWEWPVTKLPPGLYELLALPPHGTGYDLNLIITDRGTAHWK